jgi:hypothetical protein
MSSKVSQPFTATGLLMTLSIALPSEARAQSSVTFVPSVSVSSVYDNNLFARAGSGDQMARLTPGIEGLYDTPVVKLAGLYSFDMQRSIDHPALDDVMARRHAMFDGVFRLSSKVTLTANSTYDYTHTAGQLFFASGLLFEQRRASRVEIGPSIAYQTSPLTTLSAHAAWVNEGIEGTPAENEYLARLEIARQLSPRATAIAGYLGRRFLDDTDVFSSNTAFLGWTYRVTSFTKVTLQGGPRLSARGDLTPEILAAFARKVDDLVVFGLDYWRGETITLGVRGPVEVNSATAKVARPLRRGAQLGVSGGFFNSTTISQGQARVYHAELVAAWTSSRRPLVIAASYGADFQKGDVRTRFLADQSFTRHVFLVHLTVAPRLSRSFQPEDPLQPLGKPAY